MTRSDDHPTLSPLERAVMQAGLERDEHADGDRERKRSHGIVHTPPLLARAMALRVDRVLKKRLGRPAGLADAAVSVVDPACGPGAFLAACQAVAVHSKSRPAGYLGFDFDPAAIGSARALLESQFAQADFPLELRELDTLAERPRSAWAKRARTAVVIGNPPWSSKSKSRGHVVSEGMLADFRREPDGTPLREKKIGVLSDDYVRFVRWGAEAIRQAPAGGVLALVTNSSWLDGPVHRGMRACLLRWFACIDVYDLGGNALLANELGRRDENVFGVRPGVCVVIAHRPARHGELVEGALVRYARLHGSRDEKLEKLADPTFEPEPIARPLPGFAFRRTGPRVELRDAIALDAAMPFHREGVQTNRDDVVVATSREELVERLRAFASKSKRPELAAMRKGSGHYDPVIARERVAEALSADSKGEGVSLVRRIAYRPFDVRWFTPIAPLCHRPRPELLRALDHSPFALVTVAKDRGERPWNHVFVVEDVPDNCLLSSRSSARARAFPTHGPDGAPNFSREAVTRFRERVGRDVGVVAFAHYAACVMASATYQRTYDAVLRDALPNLPLPPDAAAFDALCSAGEALVAAFLAPPADGAVSLGHHAISTAPRPLESALASCDSAYLAAFQRRV